MIFERGRQIKIDELYFLENVIIIEIKLNKIIKNIQNYEKNADKSSN